MDGACGPVAPKTPMYSESTRDIRITVRPFYLEDQSSPEEMHFVWAYHVRIENQGPETVQLRNRYWRITDSLGRVQEVRGAGVVGEQPVLRPGEAFEYTSGTPLTTPSGIMVGTYQMESDKGELFDVKIPAFSLDSPHQAVRLN
jgi:ApaG protein